MPKEVGMLVKDRLEVVVQGVVQNALRKPTTLAAAPMPHGHTRRVAPHDLLDDGAIEIGS